MNLFDKAPTVSDTAFVAPNASVIGDVTVRDGASVWYGAVLRGDANAIDVGAFSNVQDRAVITANGGHSEETGLPLSTRIGNFVTVGHGAVVSSAQIADEVINNTLDQKITEIHSGKSTLCV